MESHPFDADADTGLVRREDGGEELVLHRGPLHGDGLLDERKVGLGADAEIAEEAAAFEFTALDKRSIFAVVVAHIEIEAEIIFADWRRGAKVEGGARKRQHFVGGVAEGGLGADLVRVAVRGALQGVAAGDLKVVDGRAVNDFGGRLRNEHIARVLIDAGEIGEAQRGRGMHGVERVECGLALDGGVLLQADAVDGAAEIGERGDDVVIGEFDGFRRAAGGSHGGGECGVARRMRGTGGRSLVLGDRVAGGAGAGDDRSGRRLRSVAGAEIKTRGGGDEQQHADDGILFVH